MPGNLVLAPVDATCRLQPQGHGERILGSDALVRSERRSNASPVVTVRSRGMIMRDYRHAKTMAAELRAALAARGLELSHSEALELVAHLFGMRDWNTLCA